MYMLRLTRFIMYSCDVQCINVQYINVQCGLIHASCFETIAELGWIKNKSKLFIKKNKLTYWLLIKKNKSKHDKIVMLHLTWNKINFSLRGDAHWQIDFRFLLNQLESDCIYHFPFGTKQNSVWFKINRKIVNRIWFRLF